MRTEGTCTQILLRTMTTLSMESKFHLVQMTVQEPLRQGTSVHPVDDPPSQALSIRDRLAWKLITCHALN